MNSKLLDTFADKLGVIGAFCGRNKYLCAIKNAFQNFMPATIAGAMAVLWTNVIVHETTGLGAFFSPIMALEFLNPIFSAIQYATISCISIGIVTFVAYEIGEANGEKGAFPAVLGLVCWLLVTPTAHTVVNQAVNLADGTSTTIGAILPTGAVASDFSGIASNYVGATGLFTALIVGIVSLEIFNVLRKLNALKIKMPDQVPPGVARAFEVLIPAFITMVIVSAIGYTAKELSGEFLNDLIFNTIQQPLTSMIGNNIVAVVIMILLISLFWLVGIHGDNMLDPIKESVFRPLLVSNTVAYMNNEVPDNTINLVMIRTFANFGGSGTTIGLIIAIFIFSKREDNRTIANLSIVPSLFNINETVTFGMPLVLNPVLGIPFLLSPAICILIGYVLIEIGFCPQFVIETPWTMPPIINGFFATGGSIMGAISQLIVLIVSIVIYTPFLLVYEKQQNKTAS